MRQLPTALRSTVLAALVAATALLPAACGPKPEDMYVRGRGLKVADLSLRDRADIYKEAINGSFTVGDPSLYLLLDPRLLPRTSGYAGGAPVSSGMRNVLLKSHLVQGTCEPPVEREAKIPHCRAPMAGYLVRFSDVFRMRADTMAVYLYVQRYSTPTSVGIGRLRFEREYKVVKHGSAWEAVVEGRVDISGS